MSGIFGIIDIQGRPLDPAWPEHMQRQLRHRGVDGHGYWMKDNAAIGHLLLRVTPQSQFETSPCQYRNLVVSADARLDDRADLMAKLGIAPAEQPATPDSVLIVKAYEKWGENCTDHLLGDFAFAIWDTQNQSLFCARDHAGTKPFFYCLSEGKFIFASELRAIATLPFVPRVLNEAYLADYILLFSWRSEHANETFFRDVFRLLPARRLSLAKGGLAISLYWEPAHGHTLRFPSDEDYAAALRDLMIQAVRDRLNTDYPVGVQLSGGLDSSSIACIAARELAKHDRPLFAVSSILPDDYQGPEEDERTFIEEVVRQEKNIRIDYVSAPERTVFSHIHQAFDKTFEPVNLFHYMDDALDETLATNHGVRVVLNGLLGDITVSNHLTSSLAHLIKEGRLLSAGRLFGYRSKIENSSSWDLMKQEVVKPFIPEYILRVVRTLKGYPTTPFIDRTAYKNDILPSKYIQNKYEFLFSNRSGKTDVYKGIWNVHMNLVDEESNIRQTHHHVEHTHPWLDKRIIDFLFSLPPEQFMHKGWHRGLIRFAMEGIIPPAIQWRRTKGAFSPDFVQRFAREIPEIRKKMASWEKEPGKYAMLDTGKIKNMLRKLESDENISIFNGNIITLAGRGILVLEYMDWFFQYN